jgi:hypothetical protein
MDKTLIRYLQLTERSGPSSDPAFQITIESSQSLACMITTMEMEVAAEVAEVGEVEVGLDNSIPRHR